MSVKGFKLTMRGQREVAAALKALGPKLARGPGRRGITKAVQGLTKRAKANVPVETKTLEKSLGTKVKAFRDWTGYYGLVGARKDARAKPGKPVKPRFSRYVMRPSKRAVDKWGWAVPHKYLHLVEFGTRPHAVGAGSSLKKGIQRGPRHPGARKNPFLEKTITDGRAEAVAAVAGELKKALRQRDWWRRLLP